MEIDLLRNYPRPKRDVEGRGNSKTEYDRKLARKFGREFFDGDRSHGYGGFYYNPRFWGTVIPDFIAHWDLTSLDSVLDVGCAKGFMLHDFSLALPGIRLAGIDVSQYAVENCIESMKDNLQVANAISLPFEDKSFDVVISITTLHNLERNELVLALKEISRVSAKGSFITVDAYTNEEEKKRMLDWNLTAKTVLHVDDWVRLFEEADYKGDYYWFMP
jgi:SAM-dependent methyltransferase